jgi:hypothetical protein
VSTELSGTNHECELLDPTASRSSASLGTTNPLSPLNHVEGHTGQTFSALRRRLASWQYNLRSRGA